MIAIIMIGHAEEPRTSKIPDSEGPGLAEYSCGLNGI